jgi:hypothetical protein
VTRSRFRPWSLILLLGSLGSSGVTLAAAPRESGPPTSVLPSSTCWSEIIAMQSGGPECNCPGVTQAQREQHRTSCRA